MEKAHSTESRRVRRTKNILKNSFIELLEELPYEKISVKDIVDYADFNRTTFYNYYNYKEELVNEIIDETLLEFSHTISGTLKSSFELRQKDVTIFDYILRNKSLYRLWNKSEPIPGFMNKFVNTIINELKNNGHPLFKNKWTSCNESVTILWAYGTFGLIINWIHDDFATSTKVLSSDYLKLLNSVYLGIESVDCHIQSNSVGRSTKNT